MTAGDGAPTPAVIGLRWLGHASVVLDIGGARILTDPLLRQHAGLLRRRAPVPHRDDWSATNAVLISHLHHDHAELSSLRMVGSSPVLSAPANARWLAGHGVPSAVGLAPDEWWQVPGTSVRVRPVAAVHGHRPMPHRPNVASGFLISAPGVVVWFAGDTEPFPAMRELPELAGAPIDLAMVPVGGWGPRLSGGHMDPIQAVEACVMAGVRHAVPIHWGTLHAPVSRQLPPGWMESGGPAFAAALSRAGMAGSVLTPGASVELVIRRLPLRRRT